MEDDMKPDVGDVVEYGCEVLDGNMKVIAPPPRGIVKRVHKDGSIIVTPDSGAADQKLSPLEFCVLSKAG